MTWFQMKRCTLKEKKIKYTNAVRFSDLHHRLEFCEEIFPMHGKFTKSKKGQKYYVKKFIIFLINRIQDWILQSILQHVPRKTRKEN